MSEPRADPDAAPGPARNRRRGSWRARLASIAAIAAIGLGPALAPGVATAKAPAPIQHARVTKVQDGDSFRARRIGDGRPMRIRISGIDAPEWHQPHGDAARRRLDERIANARVDLEIVKRDRYGRSVARVLRDGHDVGLEMVREGHAWFFRRYQRDLTPAQRRLYARAEAQARHAQIGLWADPSPEPPWRYRARSRGSR